MRQESALSAQEKTLRELREEVAAYKEQEELASRENKSFAGELADLKLQLERTVYQSKEDAITIDALKEQHADLLAELDDSRVGF